MMTQASTGGERCPAAARAEEHAAGLRKLFDAGTLGPGGLAATPGIIADAGDGAGELPALAASGAR
jgi:hypothetical protein